jgi:hypothetical protein
VGSEKKNGEERSTRGKRKFWFRINYLLIAVVLSGGCSNSTPANQPLFIRFLNGFGTPPAK